MAEHNQIGHKGESIAKKYLERHSYDVLDCNWRFQRAEIDLIAGKDAILVFIEVKTRTSMSYGLPEDFVSQKKMDFMMEAASQYMDNIQYEGEIRFDVIAVLLNGEKGFQLKQKLISFK